MQKLPGTKIHGLRYERRLDKVGASGQRARYMMMTLASQKVGAIRPDVKAKIIGSIHYNVKAEIASKSNAKRWKLGVHFLPYTAK